MADTSKLAEVVAMLSERNQDFRQIESAIGVVDEDSGEAFWSLAKLMEALDVTNERKISDAVNRAKVAAGKAELPIRDHFVDGNLFNDNNTLYLSKYAAYLVAMNSDPREGQVGLAQMYFALQLDRQQLEDEKRIQTRLDVATEQHKLSGVAKDKGVQNFAKFNGMGIQELYGGLNVAQIKVKKGLPEKSNHLDFAGSEELASNLFRITQTRAALLRQGFKSEVTACKTHQTVARGVRQAIVAAGNTPPEQLPPAKLKIDRVATETKKKLIKTDS